MPFSPYLMASSGGVGRCISRRTARIRARISRPRLRHERRAFIRFRVTSPLRIVHVQPSGPPSSTSKSACRSGSEAMETSRPRYLHHGAPGIRILLYFLPSIRSPFGTSQPYHTPMLPMSSARAYSAATRPAARATMYRRNAWDTAMSGSTSLGRRKGFIMTAQGSGPASPGPRGRLPRSRGVRRGPCGAPPPASRPRLSSPSCRNHGSQRAQG